MTIESISALVTIVGFPAGLFSLYLVIQQMKADRLSASAGAVAGLHESIRQRIVTLSEIPIEGVSADSPTWKGYARDLLNEIELACALYLDGQFVGRTGRLAKFLLNDMLKLVRQHADLNRELEQGIHDVETFANIRDFLAAEKRS